MRILFCAALIAILFSSTTYAQSHPCDQPPPATVTIASGAPYRLQFCALQTDAVEALIGFVDSVAFDLVAITAKTPTPSATGMILYESAPFIQVPKGAHQVYAKTYNKNIATGQLQVGAASIPFPFAAVDETPTSAAPKILNVVK